MEEKDTDTKQSDDDKNHDKSDDKDGEKEKVYREIEKTCLWIDGLDKSALMRNLKKNNQNPNGTADTLRKRLKTYFRKKHLASANFLTNVKTLFPYYIVIDFEATCLEQNTGFQHEIIEFPAVLVNTEKMAVVDHFQSFVKPTLNPALTPFCTNLTGITQEQVDKADEFPQVLQNFEHWLAKHKLGTKNKFAMVTDGPWDMGRFLFGQCELSNIPYPSFAKKWINIRRCYSTFYKCEKRRLQLMLEHLGMKFEGRAHSGLDDAKNIAQLLLRMIKDGANININERISAASMKKQSAEASNDENEANTSNQGEKSIAWPVTPLYQQGQARTYSQALKDKRTSTDTINSLKAEMKRHHIQAT